MNMLHAIRVRNTKDHEHNWNRRFTEIKVWEDDKEWNDIKPADYWD